MRRKQIKGKEKDVCQVMLDQDGIVHLKFLFWKINMIRPLICGVLVVVYLNWIRWYRRIQRKRDHTSYSLALLAIHFHPWWKSNQMRTKTISYRTRINWKLYWENLVNKTSTICLSYRHRMLWTTSKVSTKKKTPKLMHIWMI